MSAEVIIGRPSIRRRSGFSLVEISLVLGVISLLLASTFVMFGQTTNTQNNQDFETEVIAIINATHSLYANQPNYSGLTTAYIIANGKLPSRWAKSPNFQTAFDTVMTVGPATLVSANDSFAISASYLARTTCETIAVERIQAVIKATINSITYSMPLTPAQAITACSLKTPTNTLVFTAS
jgi:prepilin-type N-terminal cleavage/methylation domain-containing protein